MKKFCERVLAWGVGMVFVSSAAWAGGRGGPTPVEIIFKDAGGGIRSLGVYDSGAIKPLLLREAVDQALSQLSVTEKATVDVLYLEDPTPGGVKTVLPRALLARVPKLYLKPSQSRPGWVWVEGDATAFAEIEKAGAFKKGIKDVFFKQIVLTNADTLFVARRLLKRTDPLAIRGEKLMITNCASCHTGREAGFAEKLKTGFSDGKHPGIFSFEVNADRLRALRRYIETFSGETPAVGPKE